MKIHIIAAIAENNAIGKDNQLLWHIKDDLQLFKTLTVKFKNKTLQFYSVNITSILVDLKFDTI